MVRHKIKKAVAIAMSAVIALTAVPYSSKNIVQTVKADEKANLVKIHLILSILIQDSLINQGMNI